MEQLPGTEKIWITIWNDIKDGGTPLIIFFMLTTFLMIKEDIKKILKGTLNSITNKLSFSKRTSATSYTYEQVKTHPVFQQIEFWLQHGIDTIHFRGTFQVGNIQNLAMDHPETEEYYLAKEEIAKDLLRIKFEIMLKMYKDFFNEIHINKISQHQLHQSLKDLFYKCRVVQHKKLSAVIPDKFFRKYIIFDKSSADFIFNTIDTFFDDNFDMDNSTRSYLLLDFYQSYLNNLFNNMAVTLNAINGDLNGVKYKDNIIGELKKPILQPPHQSYVNTVYDLLRPILATFSADRAYICKLYDINRKKKTGFISTVYEITTNGVTNERLNFQHYPYANDLEIFETLDSNTIIATDISKFSHNLINMLNRRGIKGIILVPILNQQELDAVLCLDYISETKFNEVMKNNPDIDSKLFDFVSTLSPYITYPPDFVFPKQ